jgi:hypothetical protein
MLQKVVNILEAGIPVGRAKVYARHITAGRFREEQDPAIHLSQEGKVELFSVNPPGDSYFGSGAEGALMGVVSAHIPPGGSVFVEYHEDLDTRLCLERGYPPPVTRPGYELLHCGFTRFKDWYSPEGFWEGGQKLQAEKPLTEADRSRHLLDIEGHDQEFLDRVAVRQSHPGYAREAMRRAKELAGERPRAR